MCAKTHYARQIDVRGVQSELLANKCYLMPFCDVQPSDSAWQAVQKIGVLGILKGVGKSEGWENKMFFYPDSLVSARELLGGLHNFFGPYPSKFKATDTMPLNRNTAWFMITEMQHFIALKKNIKHQYPSEAFNEWIGALEKAGLHVNKTNSEREAFAELEKPVTRKEIAAMCDYLFMQPFEQYCDFAGKITFANPTVAH